MPQPLSLGVVDRMQALGAGRRKSAPSDKVDPDCQCLPGGIEVDASHVPRFGNAESGFKQLVLHSRALASMAECSTMPHSAWLDCTVLRSPSRVRCARLRPPLTAPTGRSSAHPTHLDFKRGNFYVYWAIALPLLYQAADFPKVLHEVARPGQHEMRHFFVQTPPQRRGWQLTVQHAITTGKTSEIAKSVSPRDLRDAAHIRGAVSQRAVEQLHCA